MKTSLHRAATSLHQAATPQRRSRPRVNNRPHPKTPSSGQHPRRRFLALTAGAAALPAISRIAWAQSYPTRPITIMVPFPPGGATDVIARNLAERMKVSLGQQVIIENVTGAGGTIGTGRVARASPDGYTLSVANNGTHVTNGAAYALQYDVVNDFEPVALVSTTPYLLLGKKALPASDLNGLIAWLKANPNKATQGHTGIGSPVHISGVAFQKETGTRFGFVPYRGGAPALQDVVAGQIDLLIMDPTTSLPQVRAGLVKAYAVLAKVRLAAAPDIPTVDEAGLPGFYASLWHGLWVPKLTPPTIITKLNAAVVDALADPGVRARLADLGQEIFPRDQQTPEALRAFQKAEVEKWWPIIKEAGIKAQ
jgi:tripartite-type tricarboxylate transporter receptor subunit TctC